MKIAILFTDPRGATVSAEYHFLPDGHYDEKALKDACVVLAAKADLTRSEKRVTKRLEIFTLACEFDFKFET
jgi:hypothetical protein